MSSLPVVVVKGDRSHLPHLRELFLELHDHHRRTSALPVTEPDQRAWLERLATYTGLVDAGRAMVHLAARGDDVVGYAVTIIDAANDDTFELAPATAEIYSLSVAARERGAGIGTRLLDAIDADLVDLGVPTLRVAVMTGNHGALRFYERRGLLAGEIVLYRLRARGR